MKKTRRRKVYAFYWYDIEGDASWGADSHGLPVCVTVGFVYAKPRKRDPLPFWRVMGSWSEDEPGGQTKIPEAVLKKRVLLGTVDIPWREK